MYGFLTVILSFAFWAAILYTVTGCLQLMMFEQTLKRQQPANATFKTMLPADRGQLKKIGLKILRGIIAVVILGLAKYKYLGQ